MGSAVVENEAEVTRYLRQSSHITESMKEVGINIIGVGAIGSFTALTLAKMGFQNIRVWDHDVISEHNISNQFYRLGDVGKPKAQALKEMIYDFEKIEIQANNEKYTGQSFLPGILISAVDSLAIRKEIWEHIKDRPSLSLYIDSRMSLESLELITIDPGNEQDQQYYERTIANVNDVVRERCTAKTVMYTVLGAASFIGSIVTRFIRNEKDFLTRHKAVDLVNLDTLKLA